MRLSVKTVEVNLSIYNKIQFAMNTQRIKKRKIIKIQKTEEQMATQQLFQISYLHDFGQVDEQHIWSANHHLFNNQAKPVKNQTKINGIMEKKKDNFFKRRNYKSLQTQHSESVERYSRLSSDYCIFNTVESNKVFVANKSNFKANFRSQKDNGSVLVVGKKKRVSTMPIFQSQSQRYYKYIKNIQSNKERRETTSKNRKPWKVNKNVSCYKSCYSEQKDKQKQTDFKLKETLSNLIFQNFKIQISKIN